MAYITIAKEVYRAVSNKVFEWGFIPVGLFSNTYKNKKEKATDDFTHLSPTVVFPYKISNKFIEDFERIMDFVEYNHINLQPIDI